MTDLDIVLEQATKLLNDKKQLKEALKKQNIAKCNVICEKYKIYIKVIKEE